MPTVRQAVFTIVLIGCMAGFCLADLPHNLSTRRRFNLANSSLMVSWDESRFLVWDGLQEKPIFDTQHSSVAIPHRSQFFDLASGDIPVVLNGQTRLIITLEGEVFEIPAPSEFSGVVLPEFFETYWSPGQKKHHRLFLFCTQGAREADQMAIIGGDGQVYVTPPTTSGLNTFRIKVLSMDNTPEDFIRQFNMQPLALKPFHTLSPKLDEFSPYRMPDLESPHEDPPLQIHETGVDGRFLALQANGRVVFLDDTTDQVITAIEPAPFNGIVSIHPKPSSSEFIAIDTNGVETTYNSDHLFASADRRCSMFTD